MTFPPSAMISGLKIRLFSSATLTPSRGPVNPFSEPVKRGESDL